MLLRSAIRFATVGVANTCAGLGTIYAMKGWFGLSDVKANAVGYLVGLGFSFMLNRRWTFDHTGNAYAAALRFGTVFVVAYLANLLVMLALRDLLMINSYLAHMLAVAPYTVIFFLGSKYYAFPATAISERRQVR